MRTDRPLLLVFAVFSALAAAFVPACQSPRDTASDPGASACTACHGDPRRSGTAEQRGAPPVDTLGNTEPGFRGVGAHQAHVMAGKTHAAIACATCHVVPKAVGDKGHVDDALPAEVALTGLATQGGRTPSYDATGFSCSDSYCHRDASGARWTQPRTSDAACGSCHGLPPPAPHPQNESCHTCHGEVIGEGRVFVNVALHVDGTVQRGSAGCDSCHGSDGVAAPPKDLSGNTSVSALGVGAHRVHLAGGDVSRPVACTECHAVPADENDPGHKDSALPAEVLLTGVAASENRVPVWNRQKLRCADAWCHSPTAAAPSPEWTSEAGRLPCNGCHGTPPAPPHPQMTDCSRCHGAVVGDDDTSIKDRSRHVDGKVDVVVPEACNSCHGSVASNAPPTDTTGASATSSPGVGAHQAHLVGKGSARKVGCTECHLVPSKWDDPGHTDSAGPAELSFSGVATTGGAKPTYSAGSCQATYCHGGAFPKGNSGGSLTEPLWTKVDGSQVTCGKCHSLPPAAPHLAVSGCSGCHKNIDAALNFLFPDTHVDGVVTFSVP